MLFVYCLRCGNKGIACFLSTAYDVDIFLFHFYRQNELLCF